jgi:hypothetical protein
VDFFEDNLLTFKGIVLCGEAGKGHELKKNYTWFWGFTARAIHTTVLSFLYIK